MFDTPKIDYLTLNKLDSNCKVEHDIDKFNLNYNKIDKYDTLLTKYKNYLIEKKRNPTYSTPTDLVHIISLMKNNIASLNLGQWHHTTTANISPLPKHENSLHNYIEMNGNYTFETIMCLYFADFWYQYYTQLKNINTNDGHVDNYNIDNHIFEFENNYTILINDTSGQCNFLFNKESSYYKIKFKINKLSDNKNYSSQFINTDIEQENTASNIIDSFKNILDLHNTNTFKTELYYYKKNSKKLNNYILKWKNFKYNCELMLLITLYEFLQDITSADSYREEKINMLLSELLPKFNEDLDKLIQECNEILAERVRINNAEASDDLRYIEISEQIKNAKNDTGILHSINKDISKKSQELKHKKNIISSEKKKLDKINIILIFTIILFIIVTLILLFSYKINNSIGYHLSFVFILVIIGVYILVYTYISISVKNVNISNKLSVFKKLFNAGDLLEDFVDSSGTAAEQTQITTAEETVLSEGAGGGGAVGGEGGAEGEGEAEAGGGEGGGEGEGGGTEEGGGEGGGEGEGGGTEEGEREAEAGGGALVTNECNMSTANDILICILKKIKTRADNYTCYDYENKYQSNFYNIIKPLLDNELKDFNNKKQGSKLHNNIADFNLSSNKRDLKVNIETIMYLMNISLLIAILLVSKYYFPKFLKLIGIICIMLFIILSFIYFARVLKIVRTKSYNYYWQKPELLKKLV